MKFLVEFLSNFVKKRLCLYNPKIGYIQSCKIDLLGDVQSQEENSFYDQTANADEWIIAMRLQSNSNYLDRTTSW